jgi:hypothetical protein
MSTGIEALRAPRQTPWLAAVFALLVVMTVAIIATTVSVSGERPIARVVGRHLVNTPTEIAGGVAQGIAGGTAANTPTELSGGMTRWFNSGCGSFGCRNQTLANTPTELSGGLPAGQAAKIYTRHQRV